MPDSLEPFLHQIAQDAALQESLDTAEDSGTFATRMASAGATHGHHFTASEVEAALREGRPAGPPWPQGGPVDAARLARWVPAGLLWTGEQPHVEWCYLGSQRFTEPFFADTLARCRARPLSRLLGFETPTQVLDELAECPGPTPAGFIFHMSRCGSTLIAQLLAALPQNVVLSEPEPLDAILRARLARPDLTEEQQILWLRGAVHALGRPRHAPERHLFIKFDCWHVASLPMIRRAFPGVPCLFVYRDPVEVLVSHGRQVGRQMVPALVEPQWLGLDPPVPSVDGLEEYRARVLGRICEFASRQFADGAGTLWEYRQLPEAIWDELPALLGLTLSPEDRDRMRAAARFHAKSPYERFAGDSDDKRQRATPRLRRLAAQYVQPHYERLEALRHRQAAPQDIRRTT